MRNHRFEAPEKRGITEEGRGHRRRAGSVTDHGGGRADPELPGNTKTKDAFVLKE
jgi:hypothetical protein